MRGIKHSKPAPSATQPARTPWSVSVIQSNNAITSKTARRFSAALIAGKAGGAACGLTTAGKSRWINHNANTPLSKASTGNITHRYSA